MQLQAEKEVAAEIAGLAPKKQVVNTANRAAQQARVKALMDKVVERKVRVPVALHHQCMDSMLLSVLVRP